VQRGGMVPKTHRPQVGEALRRRRGRGGIDADRFFGHRSGSTMSLYDGSGGATCEYFNVAGRVKWHTRRATGKTPRALPKTGAVRVGIDRGDRS